MFASSYMSAAAEPDKPAGDASSAASGDLTEDKDLTPEEKAEKEGRKACKVDFCRAFHSKETSDGKLACRVIKSWRKEALSKLVAKLKVSWPYGGVRCVMDLTANRAELGKALSLPKVDIAFDKHTVSCKMAGENAAVGKPAETEFKFVLAPKVTFENGKATKARANWGKIEAPTLIKSALWTATAADNTVNLLSNSIVEEVNAFLGKRCDEVKDQWAAKQ
jgi:hypothetical protein